MRAALVLVLLASPAASAPFNTFDATDGPTDEPTLEVDAISGVETPPEETKPSEPAAPAIKYLGSATQRDAAATGPESNTSVALLEPTPAPELRDAPVVAPPRLPRPTPRFDIGAGVFLQSRGLSFLYDTSVDGPPSYEDGLQGFAVGAAVYPWPIQKVDGKLSGVGFSLKLAKAVGATLVASDETGTGEFDVQHASYDAAVRYRYPIDKFAIEGEVAYGGWHHTIVDLPESIAIPDTSYNYLSAGAHAEVYPSERASIGATVRYLHVPSSGDVTSEDWYGAGDANGWLLGGDFTIGLPAGLFVRGGVEWRRVTIEFDGSGYLSYEWGVWSVADTQITGSALVGAQF